MQLEYKPDFEQARGYWDALWNHDIIDRPCTIIRALKDPEGPTSEKICGIEDDFECVVKQHERVLDNQVCLGEAMPCYRPGFGPDQLAGFVGAPIETSEDGSTSWSKKIVDDWEDFLPMKLSENNKYWFRMKELHAVAEEHLEGKCLISEIDMHSNIDMLEALRGAQRLLFDVIDTPEIIDKVLKDARGIFREVYCALRRYGDKEKWGTTSGLPFYHTGKFNRIQCDFIALLNPELYRRFAHPVIEEEAGFLDKSCFHLDGPDALNHIDDILSIDDIDAIQWVPGAGNGLQTEWPDVLHKIQDAGKIIILHISVEEVRRIHGEYQPELLVYDVQGCSPEEGRELLDWLKENT